MRKNATLSSTSSLYSRSLDSLVPSALGGAVSCRKGLCKQDRARAAPSAHLSWGWDSAVTAKLLQSCSRCWQPCWGELSALWWELTKNFHPALLARAGVSLRVVLSKVPFMCSPWMCVWPRVCDPLSSGPLVLTCLVLLWACNDSVTSVKLSRMQTCCVVFFLFFIRF